MMIKTRIFVSLFFFLLMQLFSCLAPAETLKVGLLIWSKKQREVYKTLFEQFEQHHPGTTIDSFARDDTGYKQAISDWLSPEKSLDVLYWQAGERLFRFARMGLIEPLNDLWQTEQWDDAFTPAVKAAVTLDGQVYGLPFSYYQWGIFYKRSLFEQFHLDVPTTWEEFLHVCETLKTNGIPPIALGTSEQWPAAGWFDYLDLRLNGLEFHQQLLTGKIPYTDERVKRVFETWKMLIEKEYFIEQPDKRSWVQAAAYLYHDKAAMTLVGNFVESTLMVRGNWLSTKNHALLRCSRFLMKVENCVSASSTCSIRCKT